MLRDDPWQIIVPAKVYRELEKRCKCAGCVPNVVDIIIRVTEEYHLQIADLAAAAGRSFRPRPSAMRRKRNRRSAMKGEAQVIERLNEALFLELGAVNQYWVHFRLPARLGLQKLAAKERAESIEEMHHADKLIERIIFLEGHPNLQRVAPLRIGQTIKEVLEADLAGEYDARKAYKASRELCESLGDYVSKNLFEELLADEEGHIDFLETPAAAAQHDRRRRSTASSIRNRPTRPSRAAESRSWKPAAPSGRFLSARGLTFVPALFTLRRREQRRP